MSDIKKRFDLSAKVIKQVKFELSNDEKSQLYSLFKQANLGNCTIPEPSKINFVDYYKWKAWNSLKGMNMNEAMDLYSNLVMELIDKNEKL